jgi:multicomponent Na+:H+ antiporter subunit D
MEPVTSLLPLTAVVLPFAVAGLVVALGRWPDVREGATIVGAVATFVAVVAMVPTVLAGDAPTTTLFEILPGLELTLRADGLGIIFALLAGFLWQLASVYAIGYMRGHDEPDHTRFYASFAIAVGSALGVALAADLFTFFVFYEVLTVATYPLVAHKGDDESRASGRKYLAYLIPGGAALLVALGILYVATGDVTFVAGGFAADHVGRGVLMLLFALFLFGFGTKSGIMPLHGWLPAAMVAPTPVSALLHAVAVVKAGVFGFARAIGYVLGPGVLAGIGAATILATLSAITIVVASITALRADKFKRRLAFSTIAHLSYIVLGLALLSPLAWEGSLLHIVNHGLLKITLFFVAGAVYVHLHLDKVSELDGIGRAMPWTMGAFTLAAIGLAGLPPMGGFVSKLFLIRGGVDAGEAVFAAVMVGGGLLTAGYLLPIAYRAFFRPPPREYPSERSAKLMVVPLCITAVVALGMGLGDLVGLHAIASEVAAAVMGGAR